MSESRYSGLEDKVPTSPVDMFNDVCRKIEDVFRFTDAFKNAFGGSSDIMQNAYRIAKEDCRETIDNKVPNMPQNEIDIMYTSVDILVDIYINRPISPILRDYTSLILMIYHNWNNNCHKNEHLTKRIEFLDRLNRMTLTLQETIEILKALNDKAKRTLEYEPPSFKLSRAYYESLNKEVERVANPKDCPA